MLFRSGSGRAEAVGCRTECQSAGDAAADAESVEDERTHDPAEDSHHDDHDRGDGRDAARASGDAHGDGGGDGFGFERGDQRAVGSHPPGDEHHAHDADDAPHQHRGQDGDSVGLQVLLLFVEQIAQGHYRGAEQEVDDAASGLEGFIGKAQQPDGKGEYRYGYEQRVQQSQAGFPVEPQCGEVDARDERQDEYFRLQERVHDLVLSLAAGGVAPSPEG